METESEKNYWSSAMQHVEKYIALRYKLYKYELLERVALTGSAISSSLIVSCTFLVCLMFLLTAAAFAIGEYSGHIYIGFASVGGFFLIAFLILKASKKGIRRKLLDFYLRKAFDNE